MNLKEIGDSFFCYQLKEFVESNPYLAFVLLSAILEYMGNCNRMGQGSKDETRTIFYDLINNVEAFRDYRQLNYQINIVDKKNGTQKIIDNNYLYKYLRCGMLHEMIPKKEIVLCPDRNNLSQKVIGAKNLYEDMEKAWDELKSSSEVSKYMESTDALTVFDEISGSTASSIATIIEASQTNDSEKFIDEEWIAATEA
jgi:hypothetical protein